MRETCSSLGSFYWKLALMFLVLRPTQFNCSSHDFASLCGQARSLFPWGEKGNVADEGLDSGSDDEDGDESSRVRKKTSDEDAGATEVEARETAEEKRVRLARDVIFKLDVDQRGSVSVDTVQYSINTFDL